MVRRNLENAERREKCGFEEGIGTTIEREREGAHRYKFCMLMVMETVGKIEIFFITHSAQVLVFFPSFAFLSFFPSLPRLPLGFAIAQCIPRVHTTEENNNNNTNSRSENIYVFTSGAFTTGTAERALRAFFLPSSLDWVSPSSEIAQASPIFCSRQPPPTPAHSSRGDDNQIKDFDRRFSGLGLGLTKPPHP